MKNKNAEQKARKLAHKQRLKDAKKRRTAPALTIPPPSRPEKQRFLIVCEGQNTEPDYFRAFRRNFKYANTEIIAIGGAGETIRVVKQAQEQAAKEKYDQVWVVFDKDDFPAENFDNAIQMAKACGFFTAYSNQAFEYWLILHFEDHQGGPMSREIYGDKLNGYLVPYKLTYDATGRKNIPSALFQVLLGNDPRTGVSRLSMAVERAESVFSFHQNTPPAAAESSTTVHLLVQELLKFV